MKYTRTKPSFPNADMIKDFATKPLNKGKAEIDIAPIIVHTAVMACIYTNLLIQKPYMFQPDKGLLPYP